ncbi:hypothetical protein M8494_09065 [Serratia ureilytica]
MTANFAVNSLWSIWLKTSVKDELIKYKSKNNICGIMIRFFLPFAKITTRQSMSANKAMKDCALAQLCVTVLIAEAVKQGLTSAN